MRWTGGPDARRTQADGRGIVAGSVTSLTILDHVRMSFWSCPAHGFDVFTTCHKTHRKQVAAQRVVILFAWWREALRGWFYQSPRLGWEWASDSEKPNSEAGKRKNVRARLKDMALLPVLPCGFLYLHMGLGKV
ncbi:hypothetical protein AD948_01830 [Acetobacter senegalensis]|uniref:Uncharacterized protein n=1 Tax=Acetobacter senegalensis TaxID=446692 RepID=A0A149U7P4_9PROT|nr:hypothetical protein [Acetobacter senegalensis]KXV61400.1 hypothetical protein AD948_01830 [Acetobacter senegalensis]